MSTMVERVKKAITEIIGEHYGEYDERVARAAIEAMMEPTDAMKNATYMRDHEAMEIWQGMIQAALKEKQ